MSRKSVLFMVVLVAAMAIPAVALAGEGKCITGTQECLDKMASHYKNKGWVGVELEPNETTGGYTITKVVAGSPAEAAGLEKGDVLVEMNGVKIDYESKEAKMKAKEMMKIGSTVKYTVARNGEKKKVAVTLAAVPDHVLAEWIGRHMLDHVEIAKK